MKRLKMLFITIVAIVVTLTLLLQMTAAAAGEKVTICHKPGTPAEVTLEVSVNALPAHLAHGDYEGQCTSVLTCPFEPVAIPVIGPDPVWFTLVFESSPTWVTLESIPAQLYIFTGDVFPSYLEIPGPDDPGSFDLFVQKLDPADEDFVHWITCEEVLP